MRKIIKPHEKKVIIVDLDVKKSKTLTLTLKNLPENQFIKLNQDELENNLIESFKNSNFNPKETLIVFVGQSSLMLKQKLLKKTDVFNKYQLAKASARRVYEDKKLPSGKEVYNVSVSVGKIESGKYLNLKIKKIVVIDDVISTGMTLKNLHKRNDVRFPIAEWYSFVLISRLQKLKNYQSLNTAIIVKSRFTPINTFSKLIEDIKIQKTYISKNVSGELKKPLRTNFYSLNNQCVYSPHVFCFDLFNTLVKETNKALIDPGFGSGFSGGHSAGVEIKIPSYLDYFIDQYGKKYSLTEDIIYSYVRDHLMNSHYDNFEDMTKMLYRKFIPDEPCLTREKNSIANFVEFYWRAGSNSVKWINQEFVKKLQRLKTLGHKVVLITNCTFPAWEIMKGTFEIETLFDSYFVSAIEGLSKPEEEVWKRIEKKYPDFSRNKFVMIGDKPDDDLEIPKKRGWVTIHADKLSITEKDEIFVL